MSDCLRLGAFHKRRAKVIRHLKAVSDRNKASNLVNALLTQTPYAWRPDLYSFYQTLSNDKSVVIGDAERPAGDFACVAMICKRGFARPLTVCPYGWQLPISSGVDNLISFLILIVRP